MQCQEDGRPDPQALLRQLIQLSGGRHKIFLGFAPGVGKTYRMLREAQALRRKGVDLVIGAIETHGRPETEALLTDLEVIPLRPVTRGEATFLEMDLDAILERRPATVVIDELAHSNAPGSLHQKRYEDVEALLTAGISVISALNIQHLESVADTAARLIGAPVSERVPDRILSSAGEVQLVDASPEVVLERLTQGKLYTHQPAGTGFFRTSTLMFLRELALRTVAQKVDTAILGQSSQGLAGPAGVRERILVAVSTNPASERLIRRGVRIAQFLDADFTVLHVQTQAQLTPDQQAILDSHAKLAEEAGGTFVNLKGSNIVRVLIQFVVEKNVTQVVVGESLRSPWEELVRGSVVNQLLRTTSNLDVLVVGENESTVDASPLLTPQNPAFVQRECFLPLDGERRTRGCGRHKVYLGAAPGVGKTYAMLSEAHELAARGVDVVCGVIETHGRAETAALVEGLEVIPKKTMPYQGKFFAELDREAVLERSPMTALIDELAHTNIPGCGTAKRYQDVEKLLGAGIDVISTMNVQHLESLNTLVERTTGVKVRETVPDLVLECADEVVLIDLPAEELCQRMREGKIYDPAKIEQALTNFFRPENLSALRELALRELADEFSTRQPEGTGTRRVTDEVLLVCINLRPNAQQLIRRGVRIAKRIGARLLVAFIAPPNSKPTPTEQQELDKLRRLIEELGGTYLERHSANVADTIVEITREESVTKLVLGESRRSAWEEALKGSVLEQVLRRTRSLDTLIVGNFERD